MENLIVFLTTIYNVSLERIPFQDIVKDDRPFLIIVSTYDLPFSKYYQLRDQDHCVVAKSLSPDTIEVYDPYFNKSSRLSLDELQKSWAKFKGWIVKWGGSSSVNVVETSEVAPYLAKEDWEQKYKHAADLYVQLERIHQFENEDKNHYFEKNVGMLSSAYLSRMNHFSVMTCKDEHREQILQAWKEFIKQYVKYANRPGGRTTFVSEGKKLIELEKNYLA